MSVPSPASGSGDCGPPSTRSPPIPAVRLMTASTSALRMISTAWRYNETSREPCRVCGSRTWMWTTAAPARAASIADSAICAGVTGTRSEREVVSPAPVIAQVMNASVFT